MSRTDELEAEVIRQREELARTADAVSHKLDVKGRAVSRAEEFKDAATTESGLPRPDVAAAVTLIVAGVATLVWLRRRS